MTAESITTRTAQISLREDGLIQTVLNLPKGRESLADAQANIAAVTRLSPEKRRPLLVSSARALLIESLVGQVIANFFISLNKPTVPTRLFTSEVEAVAWLKTFIEPSVTLPA